MMKWILFYIFIAPVTSIACLPNEIHIREQWVDSYTKLDGIKTDAHYRSEHCRAIKDHNYFQNSSQHKFIGEDIKFKPWTNKEKSIINTEINKLPIWLRKYKLTEMLRSTSLKNNPENPAMTLTDKKVMVIFDKFFSMTNKRDVIIHEFSHIAVWDIDPQQLLEFFTGNGWLYRKGEPPKAPEKVILPDSASSPSEDFANSVEIYYSSPEQFKKFNQKSFLILEKIIQSKEKQ